MLKVQFTVQSIMMGKWFAGHVLKSIPKMHGRSVMFAQSVNTGEMGMPIRFVPSY